MNRPALIHVGFAVAVLCACPFVHAAESAPDFGEGIALRIAGKNRRAAQVFQRFLETRPDHAGAWTHLGAALEDLGKRRNAERAYERALDIEPTSASARRNLENLRAARTIQRADDEPNAAWQILVAQGAAALDEGRYGDALEVFRVAAGLAPGDPRPWLYSALAHEGRGRRREAERVYRRIIERFPSYAPARVNLVLLLLEDKHRDSASRVVREALERLPDDPSLRYLAGFLDAIKPGVEGRAAYSAYTRETKP